MLEKDFGPCRGSFPRYYFDSDRQMCAHFIFGGCRGNRNNFHTFDDCSRTCEIVRRKFKKYLLHIFFTSYKTYFTKFIIR